MAAVEVILLQRVEKLGQMGEVVKVKPGFARNFLLPQRKAMRANKENRERFERSACSSRRRTSSAARRPSASPNASTGMRSSIIRQAGECGSLYGSVSPRDIAEAATEAGLTMGASR